MTIIWQRRPGLSFHIGHFERRKRAGQFDHTEHKKRFGHTQPDLYQSCIAMHCQYWQPRNGRIICQWNTKIACIRVSSFCLFVCSCSKIDRTFDLITQNQNPKSIRTWFFNESLLDPIEYELRLTQMLTQYSQK